AHSLMTSKQRIAASSRLLMTYATGAAIAPIIAGTLMSVAAPEALFIYMVFIALVLACFVAVRMIIRDPKEKKQIPYVPSSPKVPIVIEKHRNIPKN
ncbi:MAG: hypothetical protein HN685_02800, partial [Waddliaceae bacterium]|nr:hypothetical protein [Waddliaceae bacterium]